MAFRADAGENVEEVADGDSIVVGVAQLAAHLVVPPQLFLEVAGRAHDELVAGQLDVRSAGTLGSAVSDRDGVAAKDDCGWWS